MVKRKVSSVPIHFGFRPTHFFIVPTSALATIAWLRNLPADHPYVIHELAGISAEVEHERRMTNGAGGFAIVRESFAPSNLRRLITGCLISES